MVKVCVCECVYICLRKSLATFWRPEIGFLPVTVPHCFIIHCLALLISFLTYVQYRHKIIAYPDMKRCDGENVLFLLAEPSIVQYNK
jgi:hypothetical protein